MHVMCLYVICMYVLFADLQMSNRDTRLNVQCPIPGMLRTDDHDGIDHDGVLSRR